METTDTDLFRASLPETLKVKQYFSDSLPEVEKRLKEEGNYVEEITQYISMLINRKQQLLLELNSTYEFERGTIAPINFNAAEAASVAWDEIRNIIDQSNE